MYAIDVAVKIYASYVPFFHNSVKWRNHKLLSHRMQVSVRGCWQTVPGDASCASLELSQGWGIHDVGRGSFCFGTFWRVLGASQVFIPEILAGAYFVARYQPEDFKEMDKSCLRLGQNLPKCSVRCEADIQSHA